jgi:succinate-semialdehyde dehydrogenase/glutarate-semialdehyde dehydrogenase
VITSADEKRVLDLVPTGLYINGVWRDASDGKTFDVFDPATGKLLKTIADASYQDTQSRSQRETLAQLGIVANGS